MNVFEVMEFLDRVSSGWVRINIPEPFEQVDVQVYRYLLNSYGLERNEITRGSVEYKVKDEIGNLTRFVLEKNDERTWLYVNTPNLARHGSTVPEMDGGGNSLDSPDADEKDREDTVVGRDGWEILFDLLREEFGVLQRNVQWELVRDGYPDSAQIEPITDEGVVFASEIPFEVRLAELERIISTERLHPTKRERLKVVLREYSNGLYEHEIAKKANCGERTIRRDIAQLKEWGIIPDED